MKDWLSKLVAGEGSKAAPAGQNLKMPQAELGGRLEKIRAQLQALAGGQKTPAGAQTVADDSGPVSEAKAKMIARDEALVRGVLGLLGADYDALIAREAKDGKKSAYAQALEAQPGLAKQVLASGQPVLEALKIAFGFKPFAEFAEKYGRTPDEIKAAVAREVKAEMASTAAGKLGKVREVPKPEAPLFSDPSVGQRAPSSSRRKGALRDVFGR